MKITRLFLLLIAFSVLSNILVGQSAQPPVVKPSLEHGTIESQFDYLFNKSNQYEAYKIVKIEWLNKFKSNVVDSLEEAHRNFTESQGVVKEQNKEISSLKLELQQVGEKFESVTNEKDSISLFGKFVYKSTYNSIMWTIVVILFSLMLFFLLLFKRSNVITVKTKVLLKDTQDEFDAHRKRALEREQKLARKLHDALYKDRK